MSFEIKPATRTCEVSGCQKPFLARGMCPGHYHRWRNTGDVQAHIPLNFVRLGSPIEVEGQECARIELTQGMFAIVDKADSEEVLKNNWSVSVNGSENYAVRTDGNRKKIYLHIQILGFPPFKIDHKNNDGLDCRRCNLRPATQSQNCANTAKKGLSSKFKGVGWDKIRLLWKAQIKVNYGVKFLGRFKVESDAAKAYDKAAYAAFGEFATLNFP